MIMVPVRSAQRELQIGHLRDAVVRRNDVRDRRSSGDEMSMLDHGGYRKAGIFSHHRLEMCRMLRAACFFQLHTDKHSVWSVTQSTPLPTLGKLKCSTKMFIRSIHGFALPKCWTFTCSMYYYSNLVADKFDQMESHNLK